MAQDVVSGINTAKEALTGSETESKKIRQLANEFKDPSSKHPATTDYGIKISDHDHWLKVANNERTGPHLLEDQIAREKVSSIYDTHRI